MHASRASRKSRGGPNPKKQEQRNRRQEKKSIVNEPEKRKKGEGKRRGTSHAARKGDGNGKKKPPHLGAESSKFRELGNGGWVGGIEKRGNWARGKIKRLSCGI